MSNLVRKFVFLLLFFTAVSVCMTSSASAATIEFTPDNTGAGGWHYDGAGTLSFVQNITVDRGLGNNADALAGAFVHIPNMTVGGSGGSYTLTGGTISITSEVGGGGTTYLTGTLAANSMVTFGSMGIAYSTFQVDITGITINNGIGSGALAAIGIGSSLDFELAMMGGTGGSFEDMIDSALTGDGSFGAAMTVPEPATLALLGAGWLIARKKITRRGR